MVFGPAAAAEPARRPGSLGDPAVYGGYPALSPLAPDFVEGLLEDRALIADVRPVEAFAAGHVSGSLSIPLRPKFASWLGWLVGRGEGGEELLPLTAMPERSVTVGAMRARFG